ncbi:MAG: AAA domain-containing protein [Lachnospiraceae bacterium]|nr:AAA domain-containing protein [Lachnospiraceae bacterium]
MIKNNSEVQLFLDNKPIFFIDWNISRRSDDNWELTVTYPSGKKYRRPYREWRIEPTINREEDLLFNKIKCTYSQIQSVFEIGYKYFGVKYETGDKIYFVKKENVELIKSTDISDSDIFEYFFDVAKEREADAEEEKDRIIRSSVVSQFKKIIPCAETGLNAYITGITKERKQKEFLIYPFGVNETQMMAVKNAFASQVSVIEGPPGTGKTQTILNIIANIIMDGKTCAIVSNNNFAVENVYEKLERVKLDFLIAKLGRKEKREQFFTIQENDRSDLAFAPVEKEEIVQLFQDVEQYLYDKNMAAQFQSLLYEIIIEKEYMADWIKSHPEIEIDYISKYKISNEKIMDLAAYMKSISDRRLTFRNKWNLLIGFRIFKSKFLDVVENRESFIFSLQYTYYEKLFEEITKEKEAIEDKLKQANFDANLEKLKKRSMDYLYQCLNNRRSGEKTSFTAENYKSNFDSFMKQYPVIGSSSHSLVNSIGDGYLLDYVIIDEASQQDLVPGILCLGCAKNIIVVGDRKQLPHIPVPTKNISPNKNYDCTQYSLLDSVCEVFQKKIPRVILKEHYRCHPKIIQFCNKQFYDNQLIPMTEDKGEDALLLISTARGNHMRRYENQREIESVLKAMETSGFIETGDGTHTTGFIAPYNNQVALARHMLPEEMIENTVHKFQGRECNHIIFSTVLDKKRVSQRQLNFVDNAPLVNVAVSRAQEKFMLVTGQDIFRGNNNHIAALIRYIEYYANEKFVIDSPVISAFDLLYTEYDASLERLAAKLDSRDSKFKSEQIVSQLLREILLLEEFSTFMFHRQIYLKQLITENVDIYSEREKQYMKNRASCDFVIYYKIGKTPFVVIEVDGGYHNMPEQKERDKLKNSILDKAKIPLLRLRTTDSEIRNKIMDFIKNKVNVIQK